MAIFNSYVSLPEGTSNIKTMNFWVGSRNFKQRELRCGSKTKKTQLQLPVHTSIHSSLLTTCHLVDHVYMFKYI